VYLSCFGQCRERTNPRMGHQALGRRTLLDFLLDSLAQFSDGGVASIQQLQQIASSPGSPTVPTGVGPVGELQASHYSASAPIASCGKGELATELV